MGLDKRRVQKSIANGCYQTFGGFADMQTGEDTHQESAKTGRKCMDALIQLGRIPIIRRRSNASAGANECPHFLRGSGTDPGPFPCPFAKEAMSPESREIYSVCSRDNRQRSPNTAIQ